MILKSELIAVVNDALNRGYATDGTVLDAKITSVLKDLSQQGNFLQCECKRLTVINRDYYSLPDNLQELLFVGMKSYDADPLLDNATIYKPLVYERWEMYKRNIYYSSTSGTPTRYTWQSGYMYPRPIPDAVYNMYLWYAYTHPEKVTNDDDEVVDACDYILFKDIYREAIELGLCYKVALGLGLKTDAKDFLGLYMNQVSIRQADVKEHAQICVYRDGM